LYSDLGHCGRKNIRISWLFVKITLLLNYFGQGAWLMLLGKPYLNDLNPFYEIMPHSFLIIGILIATAATIIASQALISGSFTLINEAMRLNFWPKINVQFPTDIKGQIYIPSINWTLWIGCIAVMLYFRESSHMEAAYGFSITIAMLMTTILMFYYMKFIKKWHIVIISIILCVFLLVEVSFFLANVAKIKQRWMFLIFEFGIIGVMYTWYRSRRIKSRYVELVHSEAYIPKILELSRDRTIPKYAQHLAFMTSSDSPKEIEHKIVYSILNKMPKRADIYWFIHIRTMDEPYTTEFKVKPIIPNCIIWVEFRLGFRIEPMISLMLRKVVQDLTKSNEIDIRGYGELLEMNNVIGDFKFVVMEKYLSENNELPFFEKIVMDFYFWIKKRSLSEEKGFGLDQGNVLVEKFPLLVSPVRTVNIKRIYGNQARVPISES
jgi:KUP system potassium uptake protein